MDNHLATGNLKGQESKESDQTLRIEGSVPNSSWSKELLTEYERYMKLGEDGTWKKVLSYYIKPGINFLRPFPPEGKMYEFVSFLSKEADKMHSIVQFGPWLKGAEGLVHNGAIASILDSLFGVHLIETGHRQVATLTLNVQYKEPIPLGIVTIVETKIGGRDGKRIFVSGFVRSINGSVIFASAKSMWVELDPSDKKM